MKGEQAYIGRITFTHEVEWIQREMLDGIVQLARERHGYETTFVKSGPRSYEMRVRHSATTL